MKEVSIIGLGLMGGSLGLALKGSGSAIRVTGITRSRDRGELAVQLGAVDAWTMDHGEGVASADVVVCCAPILSIPAQIESVARFTKHGAVITDVGSTKVEIQSRGEMIARSAAKGMFIGSHPIAGSEQQGIEHARADLYRGNLVVITPGTSAKADDKRLVRKMWEQAGGVVVEMDPAEHDRTLAATSHLPHVIASLLAATIGRPGMRADLARFCGTGYRDTTRIAAGGVDIWLDIIRSNRAPITAELKVFAKHLDDLIEKLDKQEYSDIEKHLADGKKARQAFTNYGNHINSEE